MQIASVNGVNLEYETKGSGEPVALIHLAPFADSFLPLMDRPELAGYRLVRYHRRGYAGSSGVTGPLTLHDHASDLAGLLNYLGIRRAHVAGHSIGGIVAFQLAVDYPELVGSLIFMEVSIQHLLGPGSEKAAKRLAKPVQLYAAGDREGAFEAFSAAILAPNFRQLINQVSPDGWAQTMKDADTFFGVEYPAIRTFKPGKSEIDRIKVPLLSVRGALSHPSTVAVEQLLQNWFPQLETAVIAGANHLLHMQQPDLL
jgi:pimeloyl-ACP methyl ester carboxylesterase